MNKKQKKTLERILIAVALVIVLKLFARLAHAGGAGALLHPLPCGGLGCAAQGAEGHQEPSAL